jgi:hypothetical protein
MPHTWKEDNGTGDTIFPPLGALPPHDPAARVPLWALSESQARARAATLSHGPRREVFFADSQLRARHVHRLGNRPHRTPSAHCSANSWWGTGAAVLLALLHSTPETGKTGLPQQLLVQPNNCSSGDEALSVADHDRYLPICYPRPRSRGLPNIPAAVSILQCLLPNVSPHRLSHSAELRDR